MTAVAASGHEHAWSSMRFELEDGHPVVRQACDGCGAARRYRAWERYWTPAATPSRLAVATEPGDGPTDAIAP